MKRLWKKLPALVAGSAAALLMTAGTARAEDNDLKDIKARIDRLEKENQELKRKLEIQPAIVPAAAAAATFNENAVRQIAEAAIAEAEQKKDAGAKAKADEGHAVGSDLKLSASWNNGLQLQSENKDFRVHFGGRLQQDWVWFDQSPALQQSGGVGNLDDGVFFRRIRLKMDGQAYEVIEWDAEIDLESSTDVLLDDLWVGVTQLPFLGTVRVGHIKVPQGLESYTSSRNIPFMERGALFETFYREFDSGIWILNDAFNQRVTWAAAFSKVDFTSTGDKFGDGEYAATARLAGLPWYENDGRCLLHVAGSAQFRNGEKTNVAATGAADNRDVVRFRTRPEIRDGQAGLGNSNRWIDTGNIQTDDGIWTFGLEALLIQGPFSLQSEYTSVAVEDAVFPASRTGTKRGTASFNGFYLTGSYFLTGENRAYDKRLGRLDRLKPHTNFWFVNTEDGRRSYGTGAWELLARYSWVDLNDSGILGGMLEEYTLGVNWYLNPNLKVQWNYVHANRNIAAPSKSGDADMLGMRIHYDF